MHWLVEMATVVIGKLQHIYDKAIFLNWRALTVQFLRIELLSRNRI